MPALKKYPSVGYVIGDYAVTRVNGDLGLSHQESGMFFNTDSEAESDGLYLDDLEQYGAAINTGVFKLTPDQKRQLLRLYDEVVKDTTYEESSDYTTSILPHRAGGKFHRLHYLDKGHLDYQEEDGWYFLIKVTVEPEHRHQGIATNLLRKFLDMVRKNEGGVDISGYTEEGELYLKGVVAKLKKEYSDVEWMSESVDKAIEFLLDETFKNLKDGKYYKVTTKDWAGKKHSFVGKLISQAKQFLVFIQSKEDRIVKQIVDKEAIQSIVCVKQDNYGDWVSLDEDAPDDAPMVFPDHPDARYWNLTTTGMPLYDDVMKTPAYYKERKRLVGKVEWMDPYTYLKKCADDVFGVSMEIVMDGVDLERVDKYVQMMKKGAKFPILTLEPARGYQEGRHRALAAQQLGIEVPVLTVFSTSS